MPDSKFQCPHCNQHLEVPDELLGQTVECPTCKGQMTLPKPAQAHAPLAQSQSVPPPIPTQHEPGSCPLCGRTKPMKKAKELYGQKVCKKCYYGFANRRNFAFAVDIILWGVAFFVLAAVAGGFGTEDSANSMRGYWYLSLLVFCMKDGFSGHSPGKALLGVQTMIEDTGRAAGFEASFKRNLPLLIPLMPLVVSSQLLKGHRTGDGWSKTKVIWKKYRTHPVFAVGNPN